MITIKASGSIGMDPMRAFLEDLRRNKYADGRLLGLLHILIGRNISKEDDVLVSTGLTWRQLAFWLKKVRWPKAAVHELSIDPSDLAPRDRERYWYLVISRSGVDSPEAVKAGDELAELLEKHGYRVGSAPGA